MTGVAPLPSQSPAQQNAHMCTLRRQLRFLQDRKPGHGEARKEIAALEWSISTLAKQIGCAGPLPAKGK